MATDGPSASNYIHRVKRALLMMTTHVDVFCHGFDYRILNNVTPCISQDTISKLSLELNYNKSLKIFAIFKIRPEKDQKPFKLGLKWSKMFVWK